MAARFAWSPLAEGRELKSGSCVPPRLSGALSPLAEGRELKFDLKPCGVPRRASPLAEGRELKSYQQSGVPDLLCRPSRRGVN